MATAFTYCCTVHSMTEVENYMKTQNLRRKTKSESDAGVKTYLRCKQFRKFPQCPASSYYFAKSDSATAIEIYERSGHDHAVRAPSTRIPSPVRDRIKIYARAGQTTLGAVNILREDPDIPSVPPIKKVRSALYYQRAKSTELPRDLSVEDLRDWCDRRSGVPTDIHEPFVAACTINGPNDLFFYLTTPFLTSLMHKSWMLQVDCTYKLVWNDYPILIPGASDYGRQFHPFDMALVSSDESKETYLSIFQALDKAIEAVSGQPQVFRPGWVLGDGCPGITAAVRFHG